MDKPDTSRLTPGQSIINGLKEAIAWASYDGPISDTILPNPDGRLIVDVEKLLSKPHIQERLQRAAREWMDRHP